MIVDFIYYSRLDDYLKAAAPLLKYVKICRTLENTVKYVKYI